ncbi:MAG: hypothetical protein FJ134_03205 [Deltaproteobacteria bacterium]|nr:hypothetical protein [Deltaproteobacteria bacterium]
MQKSAMLEVPIQKLDTEIATRVAQVAVLKEIYLVDAKVNRDPLIVSPESLSLEHKCSTEILEIDKEKSILCKFRVFAFNGESSENKLVMKIEASFCTSYIWKFLPDTLIPDIDDSPETLLAYTEYLVTINPISDAWPYWREFVQSMSTRMGFPALTVPVLEIVPKKPAAKKAKSQDVKKESARRKKLRA